MSDTTSTTRGPEAAASVRPTVILQDLVMPDVSGEEMVRRFRGLPETADVQIIVLSAVEEPATKAALLAGGASDYLAKLPDRLLHAILDRGEIVAKGSGAMRTAFLVGRRPAAGTP